MANRRYERLFRDPEVKAEMLDLRRQGYTFSDIARKYGADCTTILFHCQIAGLALTMEQQKEMRVLIRENLSVEEVGDRLGVNGSVITLYCTRNGVPGSDRFPTKGVIKKMELEEGQIHAQEKRNSAKRTGPLNKILFKTDERGISWRTDEKGEWICLGRSEYRQKTLSVKEKKRRLEQKRAEILNY